MKGSSIKDVREYNKSLLYNCLRQGEGLTLSGLEQMTNLSRPTVTGLMRELEVENRVLRVGYDASVCGRQPVLYSINPAAGYAIGIDFDFPIIRVAISDLQGRIVGTSRERYARTLNTSQVLDGTIALVDRLIDQTGVERRRLMSVGLGMAGAIDVPNRRSIVFERIPGWSDIPVGDILSGHLGVPVFMENDVHALIWAERRLWKREEFSNMLFISIRNGIGMSVLVNGTVFEGRYGNAGFLGHTVINPEGGLCTCGKRGCLELYNSEPSMLRLYGEKAGTQLDSISDLVERANTDDAHAREVLEYAGYYLGIGIGNASLLFDIPSVVINAQFDTEIMLTKAQAVLDENINQHRSIGKIKLFPGRLQEPEYALGGCLMALESTHSQVKQRFNNQNT